MSFDVKLYESLCASTKRWRLDEHDARIARMLQSINPSRGAHIDEQLLAQLATIVTPYVQFHAEYPFVAPPRDLVTGPFILGTEYAIRTLIGLAHDALARSILIMGGSGSGKTTIVHRIVRRGARGRDQRVDSRTQGR